MHDNKNNNHWFKVRKYGYGWTPASKEGWLLSVFYAGLLIYTGVHMDPSDVESFLIFIFVSTIVFVIVAFRTGEKPRWRWGSWDSQKK